MKIPVQCPHCQNRFEVDDSFLGLVAHCTQCLTQVSIPDAASTEFSPAEPALEFKKDDLWPEMPNQAPPPAPPRTPLAAPPSYQANPIEAVESEDIPDLGPSFRKDLVRLAPPFHSQGEALTFACLTFLVVALPFLELFNIFCCLMWPIRIAIMGILFTFFFNIVTETAHGTDELPYLSSLKASLENFWSEVIVPITNFLASILYVFLPVAIFSSLTSLISILDENYAIYFKIISLLLFIGGVFLWPMVLLFLAFDKITLLFRPDLIFKSIKAIFRPYLMCWLCLLAGYGLIFVIYLLTPESSDQKSGFSDQGNLIINIDFFIAVFVRIIDLAIFIYAMRVIGLLYRHYHHLFAWHIEKPNKHPLEE